MGMGPDDALWIWRGNAHVDIIFGCHCPVDLFHHPGDENERSDADTYRKSARYFEKAYDEISADIDAIVNKLGLT